MYLKRRIYVIMFITFIVALFLTISVYHGNNWSLNLTVGWLIFWAMNFPECLGMLLGFNLGIVLDLMLNTVIGMHALIFIVIVFLSDLLQQYIRFATVMQKYCIVLFFSLVYLVLIVFFDSLFNLNHGLIFHVSFMLVNICCWYLSYFILNLLCKKLKIKSKGKNFI